MVLYSGRSLDTTRHVHAEWADFEDGAGDIFGIQTASQKDRLAKFLGFDRQVPIEFLAAATECRRRKRVEQVGIGDELRDFRQGFAAMDTKSFHAHQTEMGAKGGRLVTVKLQQGQPTLPDGAEYGFLRSIHENTDTHNECGQFSGNRGGLRERNVARALIIEDKAQSIRARGDCGLRINGIGDPANFYFRFQPEIRLERTCLSGYHLISPLRAFFEKPEHASYDLFRLQCDDAAGYGGA